MIHVFRILGGVLLCFALFMTTPLLIDWSARAPTTPYFVIAIIAAFSVGGGALLISRSTKPLDLSRRHAFLATGVAWFLAPAFGAIPFLGLGVNYIDAYFEAVSGMTTTGSTVLAGLDAMPRGILLWRSLLQWIGGFGIVALGIILMPFLRVGGMQLFETESSHKGPEKEFARGLDLSIWLVGIYLGLSLIFTIVYTALGMSGFDAINHAMTTIATGGYSTHDASFGHFQSPALEWAGVIFMLAGGISFVAYIRMLRGRRRTIFSDVQVCAFLAFFAVVTLALAITNSRLNEVPFGEALRLAAFNAGSILTTTGYATADYQLWGAFAVGAFFVLTFIGGCSGSTAGGIKIYRFQILAKLARAYLTRLINPSQVIVVTYLTRRVDQDIEIAILTFLLAMLFTVTVFTVLLSWMGLDFVTAASAVAQAVANVGPGLGPIIGPAGNFASLPDPAKIALTVAMVVGRLEYFTIFVMLVPAFWD
jgi:trk system potassium uptake protein TrkH